MFLTPPPSVTVHILHDSTLTQDNREKFQAVAEKYNQLVKFYNVEEICADKIAEFRQKIGRIENTIYSIGTLYRFTIMNLFSAEIEKVIYLDSDIIVNLDINELWQIELDDAPLAGVSEQANGVPPQILLALCREGLVSDEKYFNAGVLVMNLKILRNEQEKIREGLPWSDDISETETNIVTSFGSEVLTFSKTRVCGSSFQKRAKDFLKKSFFKKSLISVAVNNQNKSPTYANRQRRNKASPKLFCRMNI